MMRFTTVSLCLCLAYCGTFRIANAADFVWPGWLGPDRNGWVDSFDPPEKWPDQLSKTWQATVGIGYGSPLVHDSVVFQHGRIGENEIVSCLDLSTGNVRWKKEYAVPFKMGGGGEWHGKGPKSCPVLADGRLFTFSITGDLSAWDAESGDLLWRSEYGRHFKKNHPYWGVSTSPIVDGERVIAHFGNDEVGKLVALDVSSGKELWSNGKSGTSYSSPLVAEIHGVRQVVEWNHEDLLGVDINSGKTLWSYPFPHVTHNQNMPTPTIHNGQVLLGAENRGLTCLEPQIKDGQWTVAKLWSQDKVALDMSSAVMNDGLLFGMSHYSKGQFFCVDPSNGEILWQSPGRVGSNVTFLSVPGHVLALRDNGHLEVVRASGTSFDKIASWKVADSPTWAPPVLLPNGVLVKDQETLTLWSFGA